MPGVRRRDALRRRLLDARPVRGAFCVRRLRERDLPVLRARFGEL